MRSPVTRIIQAFLVLCLLYIATLFYASVNSIADRAAADWRQIPGIVVASRVISRQDQRGTGHCVQIVFAYEIAQQSYQKTSPHRDGKCFRDESRAEQILSTYRPGREVTVFYTAENPGSGVLYTGVGWVTYFGVALSLVAGLGCGLLLFLTWSKQK